MDDTVPRVAGRPRRISMDTSARGRPIKYLFARVRAVRAPGRTKMHEMHLHIATPPLLM